MESQEIAMPVVAGRGDARVIRAAELRGMSLLRALDAGWTTPGDREYVLPVIAWAHCAAVDGHAWEAPCTEREEFASETLPVLANLQALRYRTALEVSGLSALDSDSVPSFAKHFAHAVLSLCRSVKASSACATYAFCVQLSAQILGAVEQAVVKAGLSDSLDTVSDAQLVPAREDGGCESVLEQLLKVHQDFLAELYAAMRFHRLGGVTQRIQARRSLELAEEPPQALFPGVGEIMCREVDGERDVEFTVERYPCTAEVLDPRVVRIPPGKFNNRHKHAHETLFYFISGQGEILVGEKWVKVKPGDAVFSPRWAIHQTHNLGDEELVLLAITDYYLTNQVYVGKYDKI